MAIKGDLVYLSLVITLFLAFCNCLETHNVTTEQGDIIGFTRKLVIGNKTRTTRRYLGIPFAKPPVGERRFKKPQELDKFTEPFEALDFGATCSQMRHTFSGSEDCLFLNIFVPTTELDTDPGYPVMIFIHGGGYDYGTGNAYVSDTLALFGNVIVVTFNYRLGLFGFFSTNDENAPGNAGLWDQNMVFKWVNKNIGAFGGDKDRVTIFGQSAGGVSAMMHALYPGNKGLFQKVIAQSGTALMHLEFTDHPEQSNAKLSEIFKCDVADIIEHMNELNSTEILDSLREARQNAMEAIRALDFRPTVDNDFFKMAPQQIADNKDKASEEIDFFRSLDVINGVNSNEGGIVGPSILGVNPFSFEPTRQEMNTQLINSTQILYPNEKYTDLVFNLIIYEYTDWTNADDSNSVRDGFSRLAGDMAFNVGAVEQSRMHSSSRSQGRNFFYIFDTDTNMTFLKMPSWLKGATHGEELGFVFGFDEEMLARFNMSLSDFNNGLEPDKHVQELSDRFMRYWTIFAYFGNPNGPDDEGDWPQFDLATQKALIISEKFTSNDSIKAFPYARASDFWSNIVPRAFEESRGCSGKSNSPGSVSSSAADRFGVTLFSKLIYITTILTHSILITFLITKP